MLCRKFVILFVMLFGLNIQANDAPAEGALEADKEYSGKQSQDWEKIQTQLSAMRTKLETQEGVIKTLIVEKSHLSDQALNTKIEELKKEHLKLEKMTNEYNQLNQDYLTKFPERGLKEKRIYTRIPVKSIDAFEQDLSVQGRVERVHKKILNQYPKAAKSLNRGKGVKPAPSTAASQENSKKDVTEQIIFQK